MLPPFAPRKTSRALALLLGGLAVSPADARVREPAALYAQLCASCHGATGSGQNIASLLDDVWRFGGDEETLRRTIRHGRSSIGMPGFDAVLNPGEDVALARYVRQLARTAPAASATAPQTAQTPAAGVAAPADSAERVRRAAPEPFLPRTHAVRMETVAEGLEVPWGIAFMPDRSLLVTERPGRLRIISPDGKLSAPVAGLPEVDSGGQGGLLGVAVHGASQRDAWVYLAYSERRGNRGTMTTLIRGRLRGLELTDIAVLHRAAEDKLRHGGNHYGARIVFEGDYVFFCIGERDNRHDAQDLSRPNGKVHRLHLDGRVPSDNPFVGRADALPSIWSYGHRNPQGLARHPANGELWSTEHGPRGGDELNLVKRGANYGWPLATYGLNYDGSPVSPVSEAPGTELPVLHWTPSIAVSAIAFYTGDRFPRWRDQLFVGALARSELRRLVIADGRVTGQEVILRNEGRVRDVTTGPDGAIYVALEGRSGRVVRLVPAD